MKEDSKAILEIAYPNIEASLKKNMNKYKLYLSKFINSRSDLLYSNMPSKQAYFSQADVDDYFSSTGIDPKIVKNAISHTYYSDIANFNPSYAKDECTVALLCTIRYCILNNKKKELDLALINMGFSGKYYPSIWYASFPKVAPQEHIMEYVVTHMCSNKYDIVREGSVIGAVKSISNTWISSYKSKFREFHDDDVVYLIQQLHNRLRSFMNNIASLYYEAYQNKNMYITYDSDDVSEDNYHLASNDAFVMDRCVNNTMIYMNSHSVNYRLCKMASNNLVSLDEIKGIMDAISSNNDNMILIKEYITLLIVCYFRSSKSRNVNDLEFISKSITPTPNSKDKYILRKKELLDKILMNNSENFNRRRNRNATESAYYRAINAYFSLLIQEANK